MSAPPSYADSVASRPLKLPVFDFLKGKRVILASGSLRRKELLNQVGITEFEVIKSDFEENLDKSSLSVYEV